jgi:hypothetical protein
LNYYVGVARCQLVYQRYLNRPGEEINRLMTRWWRFVWKKEFSIAKGNLRLAQVIVWIGQLGPNWRIPWNGERQVQGNQETHEIQNKRYSLRHFHSLCTDRTSHNVVNRQKSSHLRTKNSFAKRDFSSGWAANGARNSRRVSRNVLASPNS